MSSQICQKRVALSAVYENSKLYEIEQ